MNLKLINDDCMNVMLEYPDNYFDLAIVDPPYGIGGGKMSMGYSKHKKKDWDSLSPNEEYFKELFRVSKNQIIWGFNHFMNKLPNTKAIIFWNKHQNGTFAEGELAWSSLGTVKYYDRAYQKDIGGKIHPTQKPVKLYEWLYGKYAEKGQKILDTHLGSGSNAIAAHYAEMGEFVGVELDADYFELSEARIYEETKQVDMFSVAQ